MSRARYGCSTQLAAFTLIATVLIAVMALAGCATTIEGRDAGARGVWVELPDGRVVTCVVLRSGRGASVDCDWATAALEGESP